MNIISYRTAQITNPFSGASSTLRRDEIGGRFSLLEKRPVTIDAAPGLMLCIRTGVVQICHPEEEGQYLIEPGETVLLNRHVPVSLVALVRAELQLDWQTPSTVIRSDVVKSAQQHAYA